MAQSRGICSFCEKETTKGAMTRHLQVCPRRLEAMELAQKGKGEDETLLLLRVQDAYAKEFWLDVEMRGAATLEKVGRISARDLVRVLRAHERIFDGRAGQSQSWNDANSDQSVFGSSSVDAYL